MVAAVHSTNLNDQRFGVETCMDGLDRSTGLPFSPVRYCVVANASHHRLH
jgi:hypothetical protein